MDGVGTGSVHPRDGHHVLRMRRDEFGWMELRMDGWAGVGAADAASLIGILLLIGRVDPVLIIDSGGDRSAGRRHSAHSGYSGIDGRRVPRGARVH